MKINIHLWSYPTKFFLEWELFQKNLVRENEKNILCSVTFSENIAFYERIWKNLVEADRSQMAIWRRKYGIFMLDNYGKMHTLIIYNTYCFSTTKMITRTHLNVTLNVHSLVYLILVTFASEAW